MVSYLAFDNRSIKSLLDTKNQEYFNDKFPLFFKNEQGESAIDIALRYNQIRSVNMMVAYMIQYQNTYVYAHLFEKNLIDLIEKGVNMSALFDSQIFNYQFDFDEWPTTSSNTDLIMRPYNKSMFKLRFEYSELYNDLHKAAIDKEV